MLESLQYRSSNGREIVYADVITPPEGMVPQGIVQISRITHQSADFLGGRACHGLSAQSVLASCQTVASGDGHPVAYAA